MFSLFSQKQVSKLHPHRKSEKTEEYMETEGCHRNKSLSIWRMKFNW